MAKAGDRVDYTVTYLGMSERPAPPPPPPANINIALIKATDPPVSYFLYLYGTVGLDYEWTDWLEETPEAQAAFVGDPAVDLYTLMVDGWPGGFFVLDTRKAGVCDLGYFGLMPEAVGRGLGTWFLGTAIQTAWDSTGIERVTVNTCTLDHPRALPLYQRMGFSPIRQETASRVLTRDRPD
ncbi:GNAT family N-acetyltransferase [Rhodobacteraceae bacterium NNCM2]|nr:GNAT family N-acetyltransferase [Coraliihabitans acroporae]